VLFLGGYNAIFTHHPTNPTFAVKGQTAKLIWKYEAYPDKNFAFDERSPVWFYKDKTNNELEIGHDTKSLGWKFQISRSTCPDRLLRPTVRVSRQENATLVIKDVIATDSGIYGCRINYRYYKHNLTSIVKLIVTGKQLLTISLRQILIIISAFFYFQSFC